MADPRPSSALMRPPLELLRELEARPRARQSQEFDPVAAIAAENRRSASSQPLPLPPIPPAVVPPPPAGDRAGAGALPAETVAAIYPGIRDRLPENNPWVAAATRIAEKYNLPRDVFLSLVQRESNFDPTATSRRGAVGLTQLMPGTARDLGVDPRDPMANLDAGARYLRQQIDRFGSLPLALAAYNAGPQRVIDAGREVPRIKETVHYVDRILRNAGMEGYQHPGYDPEKGYAEGGPVRESLADLEDRYADAPAVRSADDEYDRRLLERDPLMTPASRLGVAGVPVPRGGRAMYPGNAVSPFEAAGMLVPRPEDVQRGMFSAMAGVEIPEGGRVVQTDMTRSGYAIEMPDGRMIDPEGRGGRDVREFGATTRRASVLPLSQDVETGDTSFDIPALIDMLPMAGVQGGPAGTLGAGRRNITQRTSDVIERPLVAIHNTSPEKLKKMGAKGDVAVAPSIAITRADQPYDPFGSISLVAPPATVNPSRTPVYARDAYTPRYPRVETRTVRGEEREVLPFINENTGDWRHLPNTPENALRLMKREPWRGGEDWITDNWLLGQLTPQFRTMSELKNARERIVPTSDKTAENWIGELNKLHSEWAEAANASGRRVDFDFFNNLQRNLAEAMQRGESGMEKINREYYGGSIPEDLLRRTRDFLQTGRELPATYFEAKPRRLVPLSEFEGAVIPADTPDEIKKILERNYIKNVLEYSKPEERTEQVGKLRNLFFSGAPLAAAAGLEGE